MRQNWKWLVVGLLFLATLLNYLDRQTISVAASVIGQEFGFTDADLGFLFFGFLFSYGIAQLFIGPLLDRFDVRYAYALAVAAWSLAGAAAVFATGLWSLFLLRVLLGLCESPNWLLALRVVARTIPPSQRSLANGIFQSGTSIGALIAAPTIIALTTAYGWRFAFVAVGLTGLVWSALWLALFRQSETTLSDESSPGNSANIDHQVVSGEEQSRSPSSVREMLGSRAFWGLVIASCFLNPLQYFYITWLPRYFDRYAGVGFGKELAQRLVIVYLALDLGLLLGGAAVIVLARKLEVRNARKVVTVVGAVLMTMIPIVSQLQSINWITTFICLATFGLGCFMVNYLAFTSEVSFKKISTAAGLLGGAGSLSGAAFMLFVGGSVERSGSFRFAFLMAGMMPLVSLAGIFISTHPAKPTRQIVVPLSQVV